jgi:hypothetical protein
MPDNFTNNVKRIEIRERLEPPPQGANPDRAYFAVAVLEPEPRGAVLLRPGQQQPDPPLSADELKDWLLNNNPVRGTWTKTPVGAKINERYELVKLNGELYWIIDPSKLPKPTDPFTNASNKKRLVLGQRLNAPNNADPDYAYFECVIEEDRLDPNAPSVQDLATQLKNTAQGKTRIKKLGPAESQKDYELVVIDDALLWRTLLPLDYSNENYEWLSYETVVNNPEFRRTNQKLEFSLYTVQIDDVDIWLRGHLDKPELRMLADAFFPDLLSGGQGAADISNARWPWKNRQFLSSALKATRAKQPGTRNQNVLKMPARVMLPYNPYDNHAASLAIGTTAPTPTSRQLQESFTWSFWKTASRSVVALLERRKELDQKWGQVLKQGSAKTPPAWEWPWAKGADQRKIAADHKKYKPEILKPDRLTSAALNPNHLSLKTGVCYVGAEDQSWNKIGLDGKDCIDSNWIISCLRSDFVAETNALLKDKGYTVSPANDRLVILTELLTVAEKIDRKDPVFPEKHGDFRDGVQVRDLAGLVKDRVYVFPGSIPFVATDCLSLTATPYEGRDDPAWRAFWREHWAAALGRAKALAVIRYGLQHLNPNPQNYLIELRKGDNGLTGPSRIVIRDLQDASLHREAVWAHYGNSGQVPVGTGKQDELAAAFKAKAESAKGTERTLARILQYEFESVSDACQETGSTDGKYGDPGTRLAWWLFSTGKGMNDKGNGKARLTDQIGEEGANEVFEMLGDWGLAHDAAYCQCVEQELGTEIRTIDWTKFPPRRDLIVVEEAAADKIHAFLADADTGQKELRAYRNKKWASATPVATLEFVDANNQPLAWRAIIFKSDNPDQTWWRMTDAQGKIILFGVKPLATAAKLHVSGTEPPKDFQSVTQTKWKLRV